MVLARFGQGTAGITIQPVYQNGRTAYQEALRQDVQSRIRVGQQLLNSGLVTATPRAENELRQGEVDPRLLRVLQTLTSQHPVDVVGFSNSGPGASTGVPFRTATLATTDPASALAGRAYLRWLGSVLLNRNPPFPPLTRHRLVPLPDGQYVARIGYLAPSPLDVFGGA